MAGLLGDQYTPDPLAQGLLGLGSALLTPRQMGGGLMAGANAFNQGATQAAMLRRQMAADAERSQFLRQQADMQQKRFGMDEQKFGLEMDQFRVAQARQQQQEQFINDFVATAAQKDPEIATLARVDLKAAVERAFPKPEWRTWFDERGRQTQGYVAPGQAPTPVGGAERKVQSVNLGDRVAFVDPLEQVSPLTMGQSPDSRASVAATLRGQNMTDSRAREGLALQREQGAAGKAPSGYRFRPDGSLEFIPGGPADPATQRAGNPTEDENRSAGLAVRMEDALRTIKSITDVNKKAAAPTFAQKFAGNINADLENMISPADRQRVTAAQLDALDAALTLATGAAYTKEQLAGLSRSYFPQLNDDPKTVADKQARLEKVIETARIRAGRAAPNIGRINGQSSPQADPLGIR